MPAVEETTATKSSSRLTTRQKFWLFGVGLPTLLLVGLLVLLVFLPKPLNPTERKLLGRWEGLPHAQMSATSGMIVEFDEAESSWNRYPMTWSAEEDSLTIAPADFWSRIKYPFGLAESDEWTIEVLNEDELRIRHKFGKKLGLDPLVFKRVQ